MKISVVVGSLKSFETMQIESLYMHIEYLLQKQSPNNNWYFHNLFNWYHTNCIRHSFFKMSNTNLFKTCFLSKNYWFFGWKIYNLKMTFLSKNPVDPILVFSNGFSTSMRPVELGCYFVKLSKINKDIINLLDPPAPFEVSSKICFLAQTWKCRDK